MIGIVLDLVFSILIGLSSIIWILCNYKTLWLKKLRVCLWLFLKKLCINIYIYFILVRSYCPKTQSDKIVLLSISILGIIVAQAVDILDQLTDTTIVIEDILKDKDVNVSVNVQSEFMTDRIVRINGKTFVMKNPELLTNNEQNRLFDSVQRGEGCIRGVKLLIREAEPHMRNLLPGDEEHHDNMQRVKDDLRDGMQEFYQALWNKNRDRNR